MKIEVDEYSDNPADRGKIALYITGDYIADAHVDLERLIELRCEIDKYLLMRLAKGEG
jgi:hypothetical protein